MLKNDEPQIAAKKINNDISLRLGSLIQKLFTILGSNVKNAYLLYLISW